MAQTGLKPWQVTIALARTFGWRATYQLDWWHLTHALHRTFPDHPKLVKRLKRHLYRGEGDKIIPAVRLAKINGIGDPKQVEGLLGYLEANRKGFYGARSLRPQLSPEARLVCVEGSGAVEAYRPHHLPPLQRAGHALDPDRCQSLTQTSHQGAR